MKNSKKQLLAVSTLLLLTATGCLQSESNDQVQQQPQPNFDHRAVLVESLNKQATSFVAGINEVVIKGNFLKNMSLENPPEPIPLDNNNDVNKAVNYMLSNQSSQNGALIYNPDAKLCSEVIAKNDPRTCIELMKKVSIVQMPADTASGVVDIYVGQSKLLRLTYSADALLAQFEASGVIGALKEVSQTSVQMGEQGFEAQLPSVYQGEATVLVSSMFGLSTISLGVLSEIKLAGKTDENKDYALQISTKESAISISLSPSTSAGYVQLDIPAVQLTAPIRDRNETIYEIKIDFPGAAGMLSLENALSRISLANFKMAQDSAYAKIDGQPAIQLFSNTKLEGYLQSRPGKQITVKSLGLFAAQLDVFANNMFADHGQINVSIAAGTEVLIDHNKNQAQFIAGSLEILATGTFNQQINVSAGECTSEDIQNGDIVTKVVCQ